MHPAYFETRFRVPAAVAWWPNEFVIISAYATTGESWLVKKNRAADQDLEFELRRRGCWLTRVAGYSPTTDHQEPSWAAEIPLQEACAIGIRYRQDAIYHVLRDALSVTQCANSETLVPMGSFCERLHVAADGL